MSGTLPGRPATPAVDLVMKGLFAGLAAGLILWLGACLAAVVIGSEAPVFDGAAMVRLVEQPDNPADAWRSDLPNAVVYWTLTVGVAVAFCGAGLMLRR